MFEASARLKIRDGELEGFKQQAAEMMKQTREKDTKPLRYDWFLSNVMDLYAEDAVQIMPRAPSSAEARSVSASPAAWSRARISQGPC